MWLSTLDNAFAITRQVMANANPGGLFWGERSEQNES